MALIGDRSVDAIGLNPGAIHALWTLHGLGALDGKMPLANVATVAATRHPSAGVRRAGVQVLPPGDESTELLAETLLADSDPQVRLAGLLAIADRPGSKAVGLLIALALRSGNVDDRWLTDAATAAAAAYDVDFLKEIANLDPSPVPDRWTPAIIARVGRVAEHTARGGDAGVINALSCSRRSWDELLAAAAELQGFQPAVSPPWPGRTGAGQCHHRGHLPRLAEGQGR